MIKSYILIAWRMIARNKIYALINVLGLTLGLSACIIVYLVVSSELSYDRFHADGERIFRIKAGDEANPERFCTCIQAPGYIALRDEFTGAESITGYHSYDAKVTIIENGSAKLFDRNSVKVILTDPDYFKIFQYEWLAGDADALSKPWQAVLTQSRARVYFGSLEPTSVIGKVITYNDSLQVVVGGVVKDWTHNSDFTQTEFISFSTIENTFLRQEIKLDNWGIMMHSSQSFIKLKQGDTPEKLEAALTRTLRTKTTDRILIKLEPLTAIHFRMDDEGNSPVLSRIYVLSGLASFILIIAAINFINLSTAQSIRRTKEIGVRKVMGSKKLQLVFQFLSETFILTMASLCLSLLLIQPLLLLFADYIPANLHFDLLSSNNWQFLVALLVTTALISGVYPALIVSSRAPAMSLSARRGVIGHERWPLRKVLIVFQFSISLFFIIATLVIGGQMDFIRTKDRGFSTESVLTFQTNGRGEVGTVRRLAERLRTIPGVEAVCMQGSPPMGFAQWISSFEYVGKTGKIEGMTSLKSGDEHYIPLYKIRLIAGHNLSSTDSLSRDVVVNESFVKSMGIQSAQEAIGEQLKINGAKLEICGVVSDFHESSFRDGILPCVIMNLREQQHSLALRLENSSPVTTTQVIARVESEFKTLYPDEAFSAHFIEDEIGWMHQEELKTSSLAVIAMGVTIFISCMGIFGLAMFTATMRARENRNPKGIRSFSYVNRKFVEQRVCCIDSYIRRIVYANRLVLYEHVAPSIYLSHRIKLVVLYCGAGHSVSDRPSYGKFSIGQSGNQ